MGGSEKASLVSVNEEKRVEATCIEQSLSALGDVLQALTMNKRTKCVGYEVPYRNSVLTLLLKDCLSENSKICILATISPSDTSFNESMRTLGYLERAKLIFTNAKINEISQDFLFLSEFQKNINVLKRSSNHSNYPRESYETKFESESGLKLLYHGDMISEDHGPTLECTHLHIEVIKLKKSLEAKQNIINEYENIFSHDISDDIAVCIADEDKASRYDNTEGLKSLISSYERENSLLLTNIEHLNNRFR